MNKLRNRAAAAENEKELLLCEELETLIANGLGRSLDAQIIRFRLRNMAARRKIRKSRS